MATVSKQYTFSPGATIYASEHNSNFDDLYNLVNGNLDNDNIKSSAGIIGSKLDLSSPGAIGATTANAGTFTTLTTSSTITAGGTIASDTDNTDDLGSSSKEWKDLYIDGTANIDSLVADTADINGGTMDGVQIGGTTATGELIVNNSSDDADGLGSQGTSGQFLQSQGAGSNPTWADSPYSAVYFRATDAQSINITSTAAKLTGFSEVLDSGSYFDSDRFTPTTAGKYLIIGGCQSVSGTGAANTSVWMEIRKNGTNVQRGQVIAISTDAGSTGEQAGMGVMVSAIIDFNGSTDYVELYGDQNGSGNAIMWDVWFEGHWIGA